MARPLRRGEPDVSHVNPRRMTASTSCRASIRCFTVGEMFIATNEREHCQLAMMGGGAPRRRAARCGQLMRQRRLILPVRSPWRACVETKVGQGRPPSKDPPEVDEEQARAAPSLRQYLVRFTAFPAPFSIGSAALARKRMNQKRAMEFNHGVRGDRGVCMGRGQGVFENGRRKLESRSDPTTIAVGFNPRTEIELMVTSRSDA